MKRYTGIFPALLTPFAQDGRIHETSLARLVEHNLDKGVAGFYVGGSTAEAFLLTREERMRLYAIVSEAAKGRGTLIAHVGAIATQDAVAFARRAQALGYDAVSSVAPFYYRFTPPEIRWHYEAIADAVDLPVVVYHIPAYSGVQFSFDDLAAYFRDARFTGLKFTASDFYLLQRVKDAFPEVTIYNGLDELYVSGVAMGADGGIGSTYNFMADKFIAMDRALREGDLQKAQALQAIVNRIITVLLRVGLMAGEKEVLGRMGFAFGAPRRPFAPLDEEGRRAVEQEIMPLL